MEYVALGRTGMRVSELCFGTMSFGDIATEETSHAMYARCRDAGINFFDCANVYSAGRAEEMLGRFIAAERDEVVITTKVGFPMGEGPNDQGLSLRHIVSSVDASLRRLGTDRIEILFLHTYDPITPMEETLRALDRVVRQGKVLHIGASNWAAWQMARAIGLSGRLDLPSFCCVQPMYSLVKRQAEVEILPMAHGEGLGVISYSPLGGGLLTGKYGTDRKPRTGRLVENHMYQTRYENPSYYEIADGLARIAGEVGCHPATLAVSWVKRNSALTAPIIGARSVEQLEPSLAAAAFEMSQDLYEKISALSPTPPPATDRTEERLGVSYRGSAERYK